MQRKKKPKPLFRGLAALISALAEGAITKDEIDGYLQAVRMGIGLSKRDKALGVALEGEAGKAKDGPAYWDGFRDGLVQGYEGARADAAAGTPLRSVTELAAEAKAESEAPNLPPIDAGGPDFGDKPYDPTSPVNIAAHAEALRNRTGCYAPGASDDPDRESSANIAPEAPAKN